MSNSIIAVGSATMWLILWPVVFWVTAFVFASSLFYIRHMFEMPRTEALLSVLFALLNAMVIVLLGYQWVSNELDFDKLNRQFPHIINTQCIVSHAILFSFVGIAIIGCASYLFAKRTSSNRNRNRHVDNSRTQLLLCAFTIGAAWMATCPSSQARERQAEFEALLDEEKYEELHTSLRRLADLHICLAVLAWLLTYWGLYAFARGVYTMKSHVLDCLFRPSRFRRRMPVPGYLSHAHHRDEYGDLEAEFFDNRALVELKAFDQHPTVRPEANAASHSSRRELASPDARADVTLPPLTFLREKGLSPSMVSVDTFDLEVPQTTPVFETGRLSNYLNRDST
ncbi:hypothetical protein I7I53_03555 [Histoplasma capsulatum var. duboisii H88]|uniref:Uncharacterized protein n=2 Tax=Ajellomyces capsulatus (strain H88) TaxID=544711 RepID=A0A8A1LT81_AJEC8|nr:hypothetical protein I7I53_03555 [Histoplasma capsulatum var. duboisii H88]